ncbi:MAG: ATP-binding cassette domain-containing protein [Candidatus Kariarchaeaceae archaeon]|jgi:energy-coupling factor transporter ATP-binding protein EcfA2
MEYFRVKNLSLSYLRGEFKLESISINLDEGKLLLIKGPNGSGKTSILKGISSLHHSEIRVRADEMEISSDPVIVYNDPREQIITFSVREEISSKLSYKGVNRDLRKSLVEEIAKEFSIQTLLPNDPRKISSGEQQIIVGLAQLIDGPAIILLDEPLRFLDSDNIERFVSFLKQLKAMGKIIIISTHSSYFDRIADDTLSLGVQEQSEKYSFLPSNDPEVFHILGQLGYTKPILNADFRFPRCGLIVIQGSNGSGKTLILKSLARMTKVKDGKLDFPHDIGYLPEKPEYLFSKPTVREELQGLDIPSVLQNVAHQSPFHLSTGYMKLLAITKLLSTYDTVLMDEPFQSLDKRFQNFVKKVLHESISEKLVVLTTNRELSELDLNVDQSNIWVTGNGS